MWWWWWWRGWCGRAVQELTQRTGRNPQYSYLSIGCSKAAEERMLAYARTLVGRPFSNAGMVRSIIYPRQTDEKSFFCAGARLSPFCLHFVSILSPFCLHPTNALRAGVDAPTRVACAELVAAVLRVGGLLTQSSNPGSATPESLHRVFKNKAAVTANPYILRQFNANFHTPLGYETLQGSAASFAAATAATATADGAAMQQRVACGPPIARADNAGGLGGASGASGASGARQRTARRAPSPPRATILYRPL